MKCLSVLPASLAGELLPYSPRIDDGLIISLLAVFLLYAFLWSRCRKYLIYQTRNFFSDRSRNSFFSDMAVVDIRYLFLLYLASLATVGMVVYNYLMQTSTALVSRYEPVLLLGALIGGMALGVGLRLFFYQLVGRIFFDRSRLSAWMEAYLLVIFYWGVLLFPGLLLTVFAGMSPFAGIYLLFGLLVMAKILLFCKWFKLFLGNHDQLFLLILYFCALEIIPFFVLYKGIADSIVVFQ